MDKLREHQLDALSWAVQLLIRGVVHSENATTSFFDLKALTDVQQRLQLIEEQLRSPRKGRSND